MRFSHSLSPQSQVPPLSSSCQIYRRVLEQFLYAFLLFEIPPNSSICLQDMQRFSFLPLSPKHQHEGITTSPGSGCTFSHEYSVSHLSLLTPEPVMPPPRPLSLLPHIVPAANHTGRTPVMSLLSLIFLFILRIRRQAPIPSLLFSPS